MILFLCIQKEIINLIQIKEVTDNLKSKYENGYLIGGGYGSNGLVVYDKNNPKVKEMIASGKYQVHYADMEGKPITATYV